MGTTRLEIYQRAILHCKQTPVTSLGEANEARRLCDVHYAPMLQCIMEAGFWTHAMRTTEITVNAGVSPAFGYAHAHDMPSDLVRKYAVSASETMEPPLDYQAGGTRPAGNTMSASAVPLTVWRFLQAIPLSRASTMHPPRPTRPTGASMTRQMPCRPLPG
jgi:hypothetical protein